MTKREFIGKSGEVWTWEETPETIEALKKLHDTVKRNAVDRLHDDIRNAELKTPNYGEGK